MGLVHRDIKPANLFVCGLGIEVDVLKVLDFGIVQENLRGEQRMSERDDFSRAGTPGYMAPEVIQGWPDLDGRADLYSLGCVAHALLTGNKVFSGTTDELLQRAVEEDPPRLSQVAEQDLPAPLEEVIMSCLRRNRTDRPASAIELLRQLEAIEFERPWTQEQARAWCRALPRRPVRPGVEPEQRRKRDGHCLLDHEADPRQVLIRRGLESVAAATPCARGSRSSGSRDGALRQQAGRRPLRHPRRREAPDHRPRDPLAQPYYERGRRTYPVLLTRVA